MSTWGGAVGDGGSDLNRRLDGCAYSRVFDPCSLVVAERHAQAVTAALAERRWRGLSVVDPAGTLDTLRPAEANPGPIDAETLVRLLWKEEAAGALVRLGLITGRQMRTWTRQQMWERLLLGADLDTVRAVIRGALILRAGQRVTGAARPASDGKDPSGAPVPGDNAHPASTVKSSPDGCRAPDALRQAEVMPSTSSRFSRSNMAKAVGVAGYRIGYARPGPGPGPGPAPAPTGTDRDGTDRDGHGIGRRVPTPTVISVRHRTVELATGLDDQELLGRSPRLPPRWPRGAGRSRSASRSKCPGRDHPRQPVRTRVRPWLSPIGHRASTSGCRPSLRGTRPTPVDGGSGPRP